MSNEEAIARISAKRLGQPLPEPEEPLVSEFWEPDESEAEVHRERGRRFAAERYARSVDARNVVEIALDYFDREGLAEDPRQVIQDLTVIHQAGGDAALNEVLARLEEAYGDDLDYITEHVDLINQQQAYQDQVNAQAEWQERQEAIAALDERVVAQHAKLLGDAGLYGTHEVLQRLAGTEHSPYETEDLDLREQLWRGVFAAGRDLASHRETMEKKASIMASVPRLIGEDESRPTADVRAESFWRLGYVDDNYEWNPDQSWNPQNVPYLTKTQDEISAEHDQRRWELREHLDHPSGGFPDGHPLAEPLHTPSDFAPEGESGDGD